MYPGDRHPIRARALAYKHTRRAAPVLVALSHNVAGWEDTPCSSKKIPFRPRGSTRLLSAIDLVPPPLGDAMNEQLSWCA
eukprot:5413930-Prymnesium_polylepis.1